MPDEDHISLDQAAKISGVSPSTLKRWTREQLIPIKGGESRGDPCEAFAYHGFNGLERQVVGRIADWILAGP